MWERAREAEAEARSGPSRAASRAAREEEERGARGAARERLQEQRRLSDGGRAAAGLLHRPAAHSAPGAGPPRSIAPLYWPPVA
ncbi:unnamed protein product [Pipistrellus nathusii]|uniref:Uncharacterized protein n=1 Tax=Pipistrellus nathusii TaxID=59473 RepID=A0ABN9ZQV1_PIPNA